MMIKFLARGTGSAAAAADYLTRERSPEPDPEKNPEEVTVLAVSATCGTFPLSRYNVHRLGDFSRPN